VSRVAPRLVLAGAGGRRVVPLPEGTTTAVGRGPAGNAVRLEERNVSRRHACFHATGGAVTVEDLGSLTGTYVNGERLSGPRRLRPGDRVRIGDFELALEDGAGAAVQEPITERAYPPALPHRSTPRPEDHPPPPPPPGGGLRRAVSAAARVLRSLASRARER
jgi:hypothetical protein